MGGPTCLNTGLVNATPRFVGTVSCMKHLDTQRRLLPRDYIQGGPHRFGHDPDARFTIPPGGDEASARIAALQHRLVVQWRATNRPTGAELGRRWGFSRQTWSRTVLGQRWSGELLLVALLEATRPR